VPRNFDVPRENVVVAAKDYGRTDVLVSKRR